ncbi:MAG: PEP-CTERM sorting domain-containing protein [Candidatus Omnitrophica bacterium]|nr:PEP-CTERM sorting domain-containing protein [Candidatus Omnitrophota bacterium]
MVKILFLLIMAFICGCGGGGSGGGATSSKDSVYSSLDLGSISNYENTLSNEDNLESNLLNLSNPVNSFDNTNTTSDIMVAQNLNQTSQYGDSNFSQDSIVPDLNPEPSSLILLTVGLGLSAFAFGRLRRKR